MLKSVIKPALISAWIFPTTLYPSSDIVKGTTETEKNANISIVRNESGWIRLKRMFEIDEFGNLSKELVTIFHVAAMSMFVGGIYGGTVSSRTAYMDFIKNNQATAFEDHLHAKKKLQDKVTLSFGKGALKWCWRLTLFTTAFTGISTAISVYRGKTGMVEYVVAGTTSGILYKFSMGPRGWLVGGVVGSALGLISGSTTLLLLKLTGLSMDEVRYWNYHWEKDRTDYINKGMREYLDKEDPILHQHNQRVAGEGENKLALVGLENETNEK